MILRQREPLKDNRTTFNLSLYTALGLKGLVSLPSAPRPPFQHRAWQVVGGGSTRQSPVGTGGEQGHCTLRLISSQRWGGTEDSEMPLLQEVAEIIQCVTFPFPLSQGSTGTRTLPCEYSGCLFPLNEPSNHSIFLFAEGQSLTESPQ